MPEFTNEFSTMVSIYLALAIPVILLILLFLKLPKFVIKKKNEKRVKSAKVKDRVITRNDGTGEVASIDSSGIIEVKLDNGKYIQYAWWAIEKIIEV